MALIEIDNITKDYVMGENHFEALKGVSLSVEKNELIALTGPSGAGKSTMMHIIGLLDQQTTGRYLLQGSPTKKLSSKQKSILRNKEIGFIFQSFCLLPKITALENVALPLMYRGGVKGDIKERCMQELAKVGMDKYAKHRPGELSGGQQQRIAIARALVGRPSIILADEPTGALDTKTTDAVMDLLIENSKKATVIIITHDADVAKKCRRVVHLLDGRIVKDESTV